MVKYCSAFGCKNKARKGGPSFFKFPSNPIIRKKWIVALKRKNFSPTKYSSLCSEHFENADFNINFGRIELKKDVVPTIFNFPSHLKQKQPMPRLSQRRPELQAIELDSELVQDSGNFENSSISTINDFHSEPSISQVDEIGVIDNTEDNTQQKRVKRNRKCIAYLGDSKEEDVTDNVKLNKLLKLAKDKISDQKHTIKYLRNKNHNLNQKVKDLYSLLDDLKEKLNLSQETFNILQESITESEKQLLLRQLKPKKTSKYPPQLRAFALTLHFYSPKAYEYVRKTFTNCLPHPSTIRKWYTSVDGSPGYTSEALNAIKLKVEEMRQKNQELVCSLMMDEMSIREHVHWNGERMVGYINYGAEINSDNLPSAKEALVFMVVAMNQKWKVPVAYFLLNGLTADQRANLIKGCIQLLFETGVKLKALTFDGAATNISAVKILGGNIYWPDLVPYIENPVKSDEKIHLILDPCHMLKLCRNTLGDWGFIVNDNGERIEWRYFELLVSIQETIGLHAANKLGKRHLNYNSEKMKVRLAVQVFSNSVADALKYCKDELKLENFKNCDATIEFCQKMNNIFDVLNTRNFLSKETYKRPISSQNKKFLFNFIDDSISYIVGLKDKGQNSLIHSNRKVGFLGIILSLMSVKNLYCDLVENATLRYLTTYKMSQDHLEMFFSAIRSRGGFNNNPTAFQFENAYKKLLIHTEISSNSGNCVAQDSIGILHVGSNSQTATSSIDALIELEDDNQMNEDKMNEENFLSNVEHLKFALDIIQYIAGFVVRRIIKKLNCSTCSEALTEFDSFGLIAVKSRGGLITPSKDVLAICKVAENEFRACNKTKFNINAITVFCARKFSSKQVFSRLDTHIKDQEPLSSHTVQLIYLILKHYLTVRIHHFNKSVESSKKIRQKFTKLILFNHQ